ncbi:hypothetical protein I6A84_15385 [Frankia sp. CNm7]|uniref:Uncharacterized protein n=1 Tax=Frankia nepalensis TaxID=1836974 RepID=A0A937RK57_9ACTN|nr:hypothetical protein [Frankia nepalensis]MBL7497407.1 hypothetical protein [Frankia nepalensis]MBL7512110.1 hypothetical protein [Frankia nepalensis]MBL7519447.1 hypothetical protein [Frankia nepalensis]MBL7631790.1 hypothetical protein [Frankia nepalensis]
MKLRRYTGLTLIGLTVGALALAGCGKPNDQIYVSNITDSHGRVCTFVYTAREGEGWGGGGRDVDVSELDCEYPPAGSTPGQPTTVPLSPP